MRKALTSPGMIVAVLITQFIPLILFPADSFSPTSQVWWLPVLLAAMVLIADFQLIVRRTTSLGPWYLIAFAQGFNIISRLMMVWPHATQDVGGQAVFNGLYVGLTIISLLWSVFILWYIELPEVRMGLLRKA
jgi:hypothetical protein